MGSGEQMTAAGNKDSAKAPDQGVRKKLFVFLIFFLIAAFADGFDSFGLSSGHDARTVTLSSVAVAPFTAMNRKPQAIAAQEAVTVLLMDDRTRRADGIDTPYIDYDRLATYLDAVVEAHPKAVFLDFFYGRFRAPAAQAGLVKLEQSLVEAEAQGIKIYTGPIADAPELDAIRNHVTQVALGWTSDHALDYPFSGKSDFESVRRDAIPTAAARIYVDLCARADAKAYDCSQAAALGGPGPAQPMFLTYQPYVPPVRKTATAVSYEASRVCATQPSGARFVLWGIARTILRSINGDAERGPEKCVSVPHFSLSDIYMPVFDDGEAPARNAVLANGYFRDKVVMIGDGLGKDRFEAPVFGQLDGVFQHAIALQTLLGNGQAYTRWPDSIGVGGWRISWTFILEWAVSLCVVLSAAAALKPAGRGHPLQRKALLVTAPLAAAAIALIAESLAHWPLANLLSILISASGVVAVAELDKVLSRRWTTMWVVLAVSIAVCALLCLWLARYL